MGQIKDAAHLVQLLTDGVIASLDKMSQLLGGDANTEYIYSHKAARVGGADAANPSNPSYWINLWEYEGTPLSHGATPAAFANPDNTTQGGYRQNDPGGGRTKFLSSLVADSTGPGMLVLCDRLLHKGGLDATLATAQNINGGVSADVARYTDGVGNMLLAEIYTAPGVTQRTITAAYKDGSGAAQTTQPVLFGGTNRQLAQQSMPLSLAAGGQTLKGVTSVTLSGSTGTAGNFGVSIIHPLTAISVWSVHQQSIADMFNGPMPKIETGACLAWYWVCGSTTAMQLDSFATMVEN